MSKQYWESFYKCKKDHTNTPTPFVRFCKRFIPLNARVIDLGCGNGRDTQYLSKFSRVHGVDYAVKPKHKNVFYSKIALDDMLDLDIDHDVLYARFFLHTISNKDINRILLWCKKYFMAEFRCEGDTPKIFKNHDRNFIDSNALVKNIITCGFDLLYFEKGTGLAVYKDEDPLVARVVCKKR